MQDTNRQQLLILDIDETLLHSSEEPLACPCDFQVFSYYVHKRPHLDRFLTQVMEWFDVAVWSSSGESYAALVVRQVFEAPARLKFVWARNRCTHHVDEETHEAYWRKDLKKVKRVGYALERVLVIDDSPEKHARSYGNLVRVTPFAGDPADTELADLLPVLDWLRTVENVRTVEKRDWRLRFPSSREA